EPEQVVAPNLSVTKTPDADSVNSSDLVGFVITVTNTGDGAAYAVDLTDPLPDAGVLTWTSNFGTITNGTLDYAYGDLAAGASFSVHVGAPTPAGYQNTWNNTATATPTNGGSASGSGTETVLAPDVAVVKTPDSPTVDVPNSVGFTITVSNHG